MFLIKHSAHNLVLVLVLASLLVLTFSLTLSADTTQIPQGSEMYAPLVFNARVDRSVPVSGSIPNTAITDFQTPSVRSLELYKTQYDGEYYYLSHEYADDYARQTYFVKDDYVFDYSPFSLVYYLDPCVIDINAFISDNSVDDSEFGWVKFFPVFYLSTFGTDSSITISASLTSIDSAGVARDSVNVREIIRGQTSGLEEHTITFAHYFPEFQEGDLIFINDFTITCLNYSPGFDDRYITGFVFDTFVEPINDDNSPSRIELSSLPLVSILWNSIVDVFEIDLIPGLSLGTILLAIVGLPLLIWFLKLVAGG